MLEFLATRCLAAARQRLLFFTLALMLSNPAMGQVLEKRILLRNATIATPPKAAPGALSAQAAAPLSGLYLVQFERPLLAEDKALLEGLGVKLVRPVPQDAYVARFGGTRLQLLNALPFVRWVGPFKADYKVHPKLVGMRDNEAEEVAVLVSRELAPRETLALQRSFQRVSRTAVGRFGRVVEGRVTARSLAGLANLEAVLWIEPAFKPKLFDGVAAQIVAGEINETGVAIHELGFDGEGVTVAVADSGLDLGEADSVHPDLAGRVDAFFHYGLLEDAADEHSHGTHVAGIIAGNGATGETDEFGMLYGLGVAPKARIVAQRIFDGLGGYHPPESFGQMTRDAIGAGAVIGSNSWGDDTQGRYDIYAMEFDGLVRDGDPVTAGDQPFILEFSAGNAGPGERTIGSPAVAKNVIATGASQNNRFDFFIYAEGQETMADFSSRGPCEDGRIKPDIVAPGTWISSLQSAGAGDENAWLPISANYMYQGGTSQSGPQVSGVAAVFVQYYRELNGGATPSPALVKAALINSAVDMESEGGTGFVPNMDEGWGRVDLTRLIGAARRYDFLDQTETLVTGGVFEKRVVVASPEEPLKITLTYTDVPGFPPAIPALVNDLDLEVVSPTGTIFRGNQFLDGESALNPTASDAINNVEAVHIWFPEVGEYLIRVRARNVAEDARQDTAAVDQDFALVVSGDVPLPGQGVLAFNRRAYTVPAEIGIKLIDFDLAGEPFAEITLRSGSQSEALNVRLEPSGTTGVFTGQVATASSPAASDRALQVAHGDEIEGLYLDADPAKTVVARAQVDLVPPVITNVGSTNRFGRELISWRTDERANSVVHYSTNGSSWLSVTNQQFSELHELIVNNLVEGQAYNFYVVSADEAGNASTNDNGGAYFTFTAQPASVVLLVDAYTYSFTDGREDLEIPVTEYTDALDQTGISYEVWDVESEGSPTTADLSPFQVVIWRLNDSFWETGNTITPAQQASIQQYLTNGGAFLLSSMDILTRLGDVPFRTNVLQINEFVAHTSPLEDCPECHEDHGAPSLEAAYLEPLTSGIQVELDYSNYPMFELEPIAPNVGPDLSDVLSYTTNAVPIFVEPASGLPVGIRSPRTGQDSNGRVIFLGFPIDAVPMQGPEPNNRAAVFRQLLSFLAPGVNGLGTISLDNINYTIPSRLTVEVADSDLAGEERVDVEVRSSYLDETVRVRLEETVRRGLFRGSLTLVESNQGGPGRLPTRHGDLLVAEYMDASAGGTVRALAEVDTGVPEVFGVEVEPDYELAVVSWETSEPTDSLVQFGESTFLGRTAYHPGPSTSHSLILPALQPDRTYYYQVVSRDLAGNTVIDDNEGQFYTFRTLEPFVPPWFDDLEGEDAWTVFDGEETEGTWTLGTPNNEIATSAYSPSKAWGTNLEGRPGLSYVQTFLISPAVELTGGNTAKLTFWHNYDFTFESTFESAQLLLYTNSQAQPVTLRGYGDFTAGWEQEEFDLTPYLGRVVQFVWVYELLDFTFESNPHPGWMVDDLEVTVANVVRGTLQVTNNIADASYSISGPTPIEGGGRFYSSVSAIAGEYVITWNPVPHYETPASETGTLAAGGRLVFSGEYSFADANGNSIPDSWEMEHFQEVSPGRDAVADTDGDGMCDYAEWISGTDPNRPDSKLVLTQVSLLPNGRVQLTWPSLVDKRYRVMTSQDGRAWEPFTAEIQSASGETSFTLTQPAGSGVRFFKVEVVR